MVTVTLNFDWSAGQLLLGRREGWWWLTGDGQKGRLEVAVKIPKRIDTKTALDGW